MKITLFPSDKGDCLLVTGKKRGSILCDGGMRDSYIDHVRPFWQQWGKPNAKSSIDVIYVSHIDQDHIAGVLQLFDDLVAWRVYDNRKDSGWKQPTFPRPPTPKALWHNSFHDQIERNSGAIESMLAASSAALSNSASSALRALSMEYQTIANSIPEAIRLSRRASAEELGIPLNEPFEGRLAMVRDGKPLESTEIGSMEVTVIGPYEEDLKKLREQWNQWLRDNQKRVRELRKRAAEDEELLGASLDEIAASTLNAVDGLGDRKHVTAPNLASLILLLEENGKRLILTGDAHHREILEGLRRAKVLPEGGNTSGGAHVDVLKVQHHGSEHNIDRDFAKLITADHYIFCGNGEHENPDLRVIDVICESRLGPPQHRSGNPQVGQPFKFWFNSSSKFPGADGDQMKKIESKVKEFAKGSKKQMTYEFLDDKPLELTV